MHTLILFLYKEFDYVEITYIGVCLKLVHTIMLYYVFDAHVNIILDWERVCYYVVLMLDIMC